MKLNWNDIVTLDDTYTRTQKQHTYSAEYATWPLIVLRPISILNQISVGITSYAVSCATSIQDQWLEWTNIDLCPFATGLSVTLRETCGLCVLNKGHDKRETYFADRNSWHVKSSSDSVVLDESQCLVYWYAWLLFQCEQSMFKHSMLTLLTFRYDKNEFWSIERGTRAKIS